MRSILTKFYLYYFFYTLTPAILFYNLIKKDYGIAPLAIATLLAVYMVTKLITEIPSGIWADKYSRRTLTLIGTALYAVGALLILISKTYTSFFLASIAFGLCDSVKSGTVDAFLYDELKSINREDYYPRALSITTCIISYAFAISCFVDIFLIKYGYDLLLIITIISVLFSAVFVLMLKETRHADDIAANMSYIEVFKKGGSIVFHNSYLTKIILFSAFYGAVIMSFGNYWTNYADSLSFTKEKMALIACIQIAAEGTLKFFTYKLRLNLKQMLITSVILCVFVTIMSVFFFNTWFPSLIWPIFAFDCYRMNRINTILQEAAESKVRATVLSFSGFFNEINNSIMVLIFGFLIGVIGYQQTITIFCLLLGLVCISLLIAHIMFYGKTRAMHLNR